MLTTRLCGSDLIEDCRFHVWKPEKDDTTWSIITEVFYEDICEECFYLEECAAKVQEILSNNDWSVFDSVVFLDRVMHS